MTARSIGGQALSEPASARVALVRSKRTPVNRPQAACAPSKDLAKVGEHVGGSADPWSADARTAADQSPNSRGGAGQPPHAQPAAVFASAGPWAGSMACSTGVQQAVVPQQASGALSALLPRVSASAFTT